MPSSCLGSTKSLGFQERTTAPTCSGPAESCLLHRPGLGAQVSFLVSLLLPPGRRPWRHTLLVEQFVHWACVPSTLPDHKVLLSSQRPLPPDHPVRGRGVLLFPVLTGCLHILPSKQQRDTNPEGLRHIREAAPSSSPNGARSSGGDAKFGMPSQYLPG